MSGSRLLLDTNVALYLLRGDRSAADAIQGQDVHISFITRMELLSKPSMTKAEIRQVEAFVAEWPMVEMNRSIMDQAIILRREHRMKLPDAIIGATAIYSGLLLLTADRDFEKLKDELALLIYET
ncbi:MAG TPA: type II toxin-antitoxin system VapC family toxin [Flavobacteriales bacterium]|nr:type II toxin-antitoxin system VapC family toxin [Flavobacteriales bacterium]HRO40944.1 type II toxin-antitoxin system VapC family toxin [Flavobacteriales bacterium]